MSRVPVKICGVRDEATAIAAAAAGADFVGVVLAPGSPRFVAPAEATQLAVAIGDAGAIPVAVVRLAVDSATMQAIEAFPIIQFHGEESIADLAPFRAWECWKGLTFSKASVAAWTAANPTAVARLVVDGAEAGSGAAWDPTDFAALDDATRARCLLAGGLDPTNVAERIRLARPGGVDVSSGVERARGVKDIGLIRAFIDTVRAATTA